MAVRGSTNTPPKRTPLAFASDMTFHLESARRCAAAIQSGSVDPEIRGAATRAEGILAALKRQSKVMEERLTN